MTPERQRAVAEFRRIIAWILLIALLMVGGALIYLHSTGSLDANTIIATTLGVFFSVLIGCGLFAAAFFSSKSGYDQEITDSTRKEHDRRKE
jgi:peptidoglycan/LPS O-acetylase OafA/YrhL